MGSSVQVLRWLTQRFRRVRPRVAFDDDRIIFTDEHGETKTFWWMDLTRVSVITTMYGPRASDGLLMVDGSIGGFGIPLSADGTGIFVARLQTLQGFNEDAFIASLGSKRNARFICWEREDQSLKQGRRGRRRERGSDRRTTV